VSKPARSRVPRLSRLGWARFVNPVIIALAWQAASSTGVLPARLPASPAKPGDILTDWAERVAPALRRHGQTDVLTLIQHRPASTPTPT
jgi:hypothetical protein